MIKSLRQFAPATLAVTAAVMILACTTSKSSNPLSPSVAGPIPGVEIGAPSPQVPSAGSKIAVDGQPITLTVANAPTSGVRPLTYAFEVATDVNFTSKVFTRDAIAPGSNGQTSLRLPDPLSTGRTYYWRAMAQDGANTGPYSSAASFDIFTPIVINAPILVSPVNVTVDSLRPKFVFTNASRTGPAGAIIYVIEVADSDSFGIRLAVWTVAEQAGQTSFVSLQDFPTSKQLFWHVRAVDPTTSGPWSATQAFQTPAPVVVVPPGGGGGGGGAEPGDAINLHSVIVSMGPTAIASWPIASTITRVQQGGGQLCIYHDQLGHWPAVPFFDDPATLVEGNQWIFANIGGQWYAGAGDWYRPGQACKGVDAGGIAHDAFSQEPLHSWVPQPGELFGVMSSTPARVWPGMATLDQRTNTVTLRWQ